jgi:hypothetical protein
MPSSCPTGPAASSPVTQLVLPAVARAPCHPRSYRGVVGVVEHRCLHFGAPGPTGVSASFPVLQGLCPVLLASHRFVPVLPASSPVLQGPTQRPVLLACHRPVPVLPASSPVLQGPTQCPVLLACHRFVSVLPASSPVLQGPRFLLSPTSMPPLASSSCPTGLLASFCPVLLGAWSSFPACHMCGIPSLDGIH